MARVACHMILNLIPDEGIPEMCSTIANLYEFYIERAQYSPPPLLPSSGVRGRLGEPSVRPPFYLEEE